MNLDTTTRSLEVKLGEAITTSQCDITASFGEYVGAGFRPRSSNAVTNGVTAVTAVAAPATSEQLVVQEVRVYNADTVTHLVILQLNDNATIRVIQAGEVLPGATFSYLASGPTDANEAPSLLLETGLVSLKISELTAAATMDGTEQLPVNQGGVTVRSTAQDVLNIGTIAGTGAVSITAVSAGDTVTVASASGGAVSGDVSMTSGDAVGGATGTAFLYSGAVSSGAGDSGIAFVGSGDTSGSGSTGTATFGSGWAHGTGDTGRIDIGSGYQDGASGNTGLLNLFTGNAAAGDTGLAIMVTGAAAGSGNTGALTLGTGAAAAGTTGQATIFTGDAAAGSSGDFAISTGAAVGGGKVSGSLVLSVGAVSGGATAGHILMAGLPTIAPATTGALWRDAGAGNVLKVVP